MWLSENEGKEPKECWNDEIKGTVKRKEAALKEVLAASDEETRKMYGSVQRGEEKG